MSSKAIAEESLIENSKKKGDVNMSAMAKTTLREIKRSFGRFMSILCLIALGVFAYVGISVTGADMRYTGISYSNNHKLADIFIQSPYGLDKADVETLAHFPELKRVEYGYTADVSAVNSKVKANYNVLDQVTLKVESLPQTLSVYQVVSGRLPEKSDEIILDNALAKKYQIGEQISFIKTSSTDHSLDKLTRDTFTIVGFANSPEYIPVHFRGMSLTGKGEINGFAGLMPDVFNMDTYSIARAASTLVNKSETETTTYDNQMKTQIAKLKDKLENENNGHKRLENFRNNLKKQIADGEKQLALLKQTLGENSHEAMKLENDLAMARTHLEKMEGSSYIVEGRNSLVGYEGFFDNSARLDILAYIFPVFLFFIAALVTSTTMKRMVEEQRQQIGTFKALGYRPHSIMEKYLVYGLISGIIGTILGVILGLSLLPQLIYSAYKSSYIFTNLLLRFSPFYAGIGALIAILCTVVPVILAVISSLREKTTELMRPKAPKAGKRILLERIPFIWKRLSFSSKVTARNIFRYKERMMMTILGVAGSIALLIMGFGIRDSLTTTIDLQLNKIYKFDVISQFNPEAPANALTEYDALLNKNTAINSAEKVIYDFAEITKKGAKDKGIESKDITVIVPQTPSDLHQYIALIDAKGQAIALQDDGVVLSQKIAEMLNVKVGDEIELIQNDKTYHAKVGTINQWYFGNQIVFSPKYYQTVFSKAPIYNAYLLRVSNENAIPRVLSDLENSEANLSATTLSSTTDLAKGNLDGLNLVMVVLLGLAILLAVIVLYNLTNINISERIRELSTIKVLGFYPSEVTRYIYRETFLLTIIGIMIGWLLGTALEQFVVIEIPPEQIMFYRKILWSNYAISSAIIIVVAIVIMFVMHRKLKRVNMLDALKSVE